MDDIYLNRICLRYIVYIQLLLSLNYTVLSLNQCNDNACLAIRLNYLSSCEAFILYSHHCDGYFDSQVCNFIQSGSDRCTNDISTVYPTLLMYHCYPGFTGDDCNEACDENKFGPGCRGECQCQNGATCSALDGSCKCPVGWTGQYCERTCIEGFYGEGCSQQCPNCHNLSFCNRVTGECICAPNHDGELCTEECSGSEVGGVCMQMCQLCPDNCGYRTCCDHVFNFCLCGPGWMGRYCTEQCEIGKYGQDCKNTCKCKNDAVCLHEDGKCICTPGFKGTLCDEPCEEGFYGEQCLEKCNCPYNSSCDHVTGECHCRGDWQGPICNEVDHCKPSQHCQPANGTCIDIKKYHYDEYNSNLDEPIAKASNSIKIGIAAGAGAITFLFLVLFTIYCSKRTRVKSRTYTMDTKLPLFSKGPQPPPRPAITTFNNEPVYDSIGEGGHYLEIIDDKPTGIYNPEYIISGGEGYLIPSTIPGLVDQHTSSDESSYSTEGSSSLS